MDTSRPPLTQKRSPPCTVLLICAALCISPGTAPAEKTVSNLADRDNTCFLQAPTPFTVGKTVAVPGTIYSIDTSASGDVVYLAGNLPLIISVPHGGTLAPPIPERKGPWGFINKQDDVGTIDLACDLIRAIMDRTNGKYPHVVINNISRAKIDQNRGWGEDRNPTSGRGGEAWKDFHERFIASVAIPEVLKQYNTGLFIDLHGKPDTYGADIIIGYNLTARDLSNSDKMLNSSKKSYADKSTLRFLAKKLAAVVDFAELLRGATRNHESFGSLLQMGMNDINRDYKKKYSVIPRHDLKHPFVNLSGGYNIQTYCGVRHGADDNRYGYTPSRFISGFQIEVCREIRIKNRSLRIDFARKLADAVIAYVERNLNIKM
jgi:hypothetical protein